MISTSQNFFHSVQSKGLLVLVHSEKIQGKLSHWSVETYKTNESIKLTAQITTGIDAKCNEKAVFVTSVFFYYFYENMPTVKCVHILFVLLNMKFLWFSGI